MTEKVIPHATSVAVVKTPPAEVDASSDMALKIKVSCQSQCDLRGDQVRVINESGMTLKEIELLPSDGTANATNEFILQAPVRPGEYAWTATYVAQQKGGLLHTAGEAPFAFLVRPHGTSVQIWDVPSTVVLGSTFKIKVGAQCSAGCNLAGQKIAVYEYEGVQVATATLGEVPWATSSAQSCAEVELKAPGIESRFMWEVKFVQPDLELAHMESVSTFALAVAPPPEHKVTVQVFDQQTQSPIQNASVILRPSIYRGSEYLNYTDDAGTATVSVPKGEYHITATKNGYKSNIQIAEVAGDLAVTAELVVGSDLDDMWG